METTMGARWGTPALGLLLGGAMFVAATIGGEPELGLAMFAVMVAYTFLLVGLSGRSEVVAVLRGRPADERLAGFNVHATAVAGTVALVVALGGFLWEIAQGQSGNDFAIVVMAGALAYLASLVWFRWRR
jgi:multisubunit Na+/H+ antiporter MnhF subunit